MCDPNYKIDDYDVPLEKMKISKYALDDNFEKSEQHLKGLIYISNLLFEHFCYEKCKFEN